MFSSKSAKQSDFVGYIVSEVKRRLAEELKVSSNVVTPQAADLKIKFSRHIYATFTCKNCLKDWASSKATCEIEYIIKRNGTLGSRHILYYVHVYRQKCLICNAYGTAHADEHEMDWIVDEYIEKVNQIITNAPKTQKLGQKKGALLQGHKSNLCEACQLGKCSQANEGMKESSDPKGIMRELSGLLGRLKLN